LAKFTRIDTLLRMLGRIGLGIAMLLGGLVTVTRAAGPTSRPSTRTGDVRTHDAFHSKVLGNDRRLWVYLPPGYDASADRYPVLYMHDGQNLFDAATSFVGEWQADESAERLIKSRAIQPLVIVGIDNTPARMDEYTPTRDVHYGVGGNGERYARFVVEEVKPFIDRTYRTLPDRDHTAVAGSSLGGLISLYCALKYPDTFSRIGIVSPSLQWDEGRLLKEAKAADPALIRRCAYWLDMGTSEGNAEQSARMISYARDLAAAFQTAGLRKDHDFRYVEAHGAAHNEAAWAKRFPGMLEFFFPAPTPPRAGS
jgi:predicted alpha/beta superfamily hydrolase